MESIPRYIEIDIAKGLAIILVVYGHLTQGYIPDDHNWYRVSQQILYSFHMPLFMFLSGFVYNILATRNLKKIGWVNFSKRVLWRMLPGWLAVGVVIITLKILLGSELNVNNQVNFSFTSYLEIFYIPGNSGARSLWYVHTLVILYCVFSAVEYCWPDSKKWRLYIAFPISLAAVFFIISSIIALDRVMFYSVFFALGALAFENWNKVQKICKSYFLLWIILFVGLFFINFENWYVTKYVRGLFSIPFMIGLVSFLGGRIAAFFTYIGSYTYTIYLFNTLAIGLMITLFRKIGYFDGKGFYIYGLLTLAIGSIGCILGHQILNKFSPKLAKYFK